MSETPVAYAEKGRFPFNAARRPAGPAGSACSAVRKSSRRFWNSRGRRIREFGYIDTGDPKPLIRLACQAQAFGAVSIVIPPWNGVFGKLIRNQKTDSE